jgi:hypothetical protein
MCAACGCGAYMILEKISNINNKPAGTQKGFASSAQPNAFGCVCTRESSTRACVHEEFISGAMLAFSIESN